MIIENKVILITGATGGIGRWLAILLAKKNARLILVGRNESTLNKIKKKLNANSQQPVHRTFVADLNFEDDRQTLLNFSSEIDILINLAGVNQLAIFEDMDDSDIQQIIQTNLISPMKLCHAFLPILKQRKKATIVNIGSILGSIGIPGSTAYCASKFGLRGFSESLRRELSDTNIDVVYVAPRATNTGMNDDAANSLNKELGNSVDSPTSVAKQIVSAIEQSNKNLYLGWPEKLFVRINALFPKIVDATFKKQLPIIKQYSSR